jgi:hypothetical protein
MRPPVCSKRRFQKHQYFESESQPPCKTPSARCVCFMPTFDLVRLHDNTNRFRTLLLTHPKLQSSSKSSKMSYTYHPCTNRVPLDQTILPDRIHRHRLRTVFPELAPCRPALGDLRLAQMKEWQAFWRHLAIRTPKRDVCQFCWGVGHQATSCEEFVSSSNVSGVKLG